MSTPETDTPHTWDNTACRLCENCTFFSPAWSNSYGQHRCCYSATGNTEVLPTLPACEHFMQTRRKY